MLIFWVQRAYPELQKIFYREYSKRVDLNNVEIKLVIFVEGVNRFKNDGGYINDDQANNYKIKEPAGRISVSFSNQNCIKFLSKIFYGRYKVISYKAIGTEHFI